MQADGEAGGLLSDADVEAVVFAVAFASVLASLHSPVEVAGYATGVAVGTSSGVALDSRLSAGQSTVRVIVDGDGELLAEELRGAGWPVTRLDGHGLRGHATLLLVIVDDDRLPRLLKQLRVLGPGALWTVERLQHAQPSTLPAGYRQIGRRNHPRRHSRRGQLVQPGGSR